MFRIRHPFQSSLFPLNLEDKNRLLKRDLLSLCKSKTKYESY